MMRYIPKLCIFRYLFLIRIAIAPWHGTAQQYNFKSYSVENGLPYIQIFAMYQDSKGYLWSGGYGGLSQFNGKVFHNYSPKNGLANHYVNAIAEDRDGRIFVGTINGLSVIEQKHIKNYSVANGLPSKNVTAICTDHEGNMWIGTTDGLCVFKNNALKRFAVLPLKNINCLYYHAKSGIWVGTNEGLYNINHHSISSYTSQKGLSDNVILSISQNPLTHKLFVGTKNGLSVMDIETKKVVRYHVSNGLIDESVLAITCTQSGIVWIGSKSGLISFNGKEFSYFSIRPDNNSNHITSLLMDYEGNLWIGTHNGMFKYRDKGFTTYGKQEGLGEAFIYQIVGDLEKNIWITTESNGVYRYAQGFFKNYAEKDGLLSNCAQSALSMPDGSVWFGTSEGISKLKKNGIENIVYSDGFKMTPPITNIYTDSKHNIWVGGKNGLCCMKKTDHSYQTVYYTLPTTIKNYDVWSIKEDDQGNIWAGTYLAGLYKLVGNTFQNQSGVLKQFIESALEIDADNTGHIYIATLNGILVVNTRNYSTKIISEKEGLISELVYTLKVSNNNKNLWAGTNQGISRIDLDKLNHNIIDIESYNKTDGFEGVECNTHGIYEDSNSNLWFGTVNGVIKYSPKEVIKNDNLSKTTITNIKLAYTDTILPNGAVLPYSFNNISFYFDGICLTNPDKVLYTYKLEGKDKDWSPYSEVNMAKYDNLPAGKYTFKVKSCNNEGIWNVEPTTFSFEIKQAFYKTWWFITGLISLIVTCIIIIFKVRLRQLNKKEKEKLEREVEVSKAELKALRAQMNPHFVFNSLNSIQHYILTRKSEEAVKYLNKFAKLIRTILNHSDKPTVTINQDIESLKLYLELEKMRFDDKFEYRFTIDPAINGDYDEIPPMLIQPYLENAILHGINPKAGKGHIEVTIKYTSPFIKISVRDDGIGRFHAKAIQNSQAGTVHQSMGMRITEDRVRILNNMNKSNLSVNIIDLHDPEGEPAGTQVDVFIPYMK